MLCMALEFNSFETGKNTLLKKRIFESHTKTSGSAIRTSLLVRINPKNQQQVYLGGGFKYFLFSPLFEEDLQFD